MSVVVVDEGDVETEDEKNQREIEEFILSSVLDDDDDGDYEPPPSLQRQSSADELAFAEIEKAMSNAEATKSGYSGQHAWSQQPQGNASSANGTNFNASSYNYQSGGDYGGGYQQYDGGDIPVGQQDWFHDCQGCECCSGYKYNCICCEVDANGYQHSDCCTYCFYGGSNSYAGGNSNSNSNYGYNNQLGSRAATNNTASLNTKATEWVPGQSFMPQQQAAAQTATQYPNTVFKAGNVHFPKSNTPPPAAATAGRSDGPPLCQFMVKNGFCRSGAKCKFKHP